MEKKDFYEYAVKSNIDDIVNNDEDVIKMRDNKLKSESAKVIEAASYITENGFGKLKFEKCLNSRFRKYDYNWAQIYIQQFKIYLFFVDNKETRDIIFQLYGRRRSILIFDMDVDMDFIGNELSRKISFMLEQGRLSNGE